MKKNRGDFKMIGNFASAGMTEDDLRKILESTFPITDKADIMLQRISECLETGEIQVSPERMQAFHKGLGKVCRELLDTFEGDEPLAVLLSARVFVSLWVSMFASHEAFHRRQTGMN